MSDKDPSNVFLLCDVCRSNCLLTGPAARAIADDPPRCTCGTPMRAVRTPRRRVS